MSLRHLLCSAAALALFAAPFNVSAQVKLPNMLSDHAVLQRGMPIHIWGWSSPGEKVAVSFHSQKMNTTADDLGKWSVYLQPEQAGGPYTLTVAGTTTETRNDILVGDVWFASGQSNMQFPLKGFGNGTDLKDQAKEIAAATHPNIRLLRFPDKASDFPLSDQPSTWTDCTPETAAEFSAVAYFYGREISEREHVPVGLIDSTWGGTPVESWMSLETLSNPALSPVWRTRAQFEDGLTDLDATVAREKREDAAAAAEGKPAPKHPWHPNEVSWAPSALFNGMIAPAVPYTVRGFLWYQGETNSGPQRAPLYSALFSTMINDWRARWNEGMLPFLYVQISSFNSPPEDWGTLRDQQRRTLEVANTAMAVSLDKGTFDNVHPPDKQTVGHRLALAGRALSYGEKVEFSGPLFRTAYTQNGAMHVWFDHAEGLHAAGAVKGFEVAGSDGKFSPAEATVEGTSVVVRSASVPQPVAVRYGWTNYTDANLYNAADLPASTFTSQR